MGVTKEVESLRFGERSPDSWYDDRLELRSLISGDELVEQCYLKNGGRQIAITPALDSEKLLAVLNRVDKSVQDQLKTDQGRQEILDVVVKSAKVSIATKLAELK